MTIKVDLLLHLFITPLQFIVQNFSRASVKASTPEPPHTSKQWNAFLLSNKNNFFMQNCLEGISFLYHS